jgi:hypothetical protein
MVMIRQTAMLAVLAVALNGMWNHALADDPPGEGERVDYPVDSPLYTLHGPDWPMIALIQTGEELEYIGDYLHLDMERAENALRMLRHMDFEQSMLLIVNGGLVEGAMLRIQSVFQLEGELHVVVVTDEPPQQYLDSGFASPTSDILTPSVVTVLPKFQGRVVVHSFPAQWAVSGDWRGVEVVVPFPSDEGGDEGASEEDRQ